MNSRRLTTINAPIKGHFRLSEGRHARNIGSKSSLKGNILLPFTMPMPAQETQMYSGSRRRASPTITNALPNTSPRFNATANLNNGRVGMCNSSRPPRRKIQRRRYLLCPSAISRVHQAILPASLSQPGQGRTPIHPEAMNGLYFMYFCACLVERTWRFALPLCLAYVEGGYQAIAVLGFVSPLGCSLFGPLTGRLLDNMYRPYGLSLMIALQGIAIMASGLVVLTAAAHPTVKFVDGPLFIVLLVLSMIERLTAILSELAIERDWVTQLSGKDNALALASSNAMLRRIDLSCELVGSLTFGWLYSKAGLTISVASATVLALILLPAQLVNIFKIAKMAPEAMVHGRSEAEVALFKPLPWKRLLGKEKKKTQNDNTDGTVNTSENNTDSSATTKKIPILQRIQNQLLHAADGWKAYFRQPILFSSLTFVLIFFNVALSPGGMITAFLTAKGLDGIGMAVFRSGCAGNYQLELFRSFLCILLIGSN